MTTKIITTNPLIRTKYVNLVSTTYIGRSKKVEEWVSIERVDNQKAVMVVALIPGISSLVITKEYRVPIQNYEWGFPAGLIEPGHTIEETVIKELKEETGLDVQRFIRPVSPFVYNSPGLTNESISIAYVEASGEISKDYLEELEDISTFIYSRASVQQLMAEAMELNSSVFIGAKAWLIFERFVKYGEV